MGDHLLMTQNEKKSGEDANEKNGLRLFYEEAWMRKGLYPNRFPIF